MASWLIALRRALQSLGSARSALFALEESRGSALVGAVQAEVAFEQAQKPRNLKGPVRAGGERLMMFDVPHVLHSPSSSSSVLPPGACPLVSVICMKEVGVSVGPPMAAEAWSMVETTWVSSVTCGEIFSLGLHCDLADKTLF